MSQPNSNSVPATNRPGGAAAGVRTRAQARDGTNANEAAGNEPRALHNNEGAGENAQNIEERRADAAQAANADEENAAQGQPQRQPILRIPRVADAANAATGPLQEHGEAAEATEQA